MPELQDGKGAAVALAQDGQQLTFATQAGQEYNLQLSNKEIARRRQP
jgi:hypothetical protein